MAGVSSTRTSRLVKAPIEAVYRAFTEPAALEAWMCPGGMTAKVHEFDGRVGGGYRMSLFYPQPTSSGKTSEREDRYTARYIELTPPTKVVQAITFESENPAFSGEMKMEVTLEEKGHEATEVTVAFDDIPPGIRPEDNDAGTRSSLDKLSRYLE